jgi:hypothetical protein
VDPAAWLAEQIGACEPDLLRSMVKTMAEALMSAEADAVCGGRVRAAFGRARQPAERVSGAEVGHPRREGRAFDSEAAVRLLLSRVAVGTPPSRAGSGLGGGDPGDRGSGTGDGKSGAATDRRRTAGGKSGSVTAEEVEPLAAEAEPLVVAELGTEMDVLVTRAEAPVTGGDVVVSADQEARLWAAG